MPSLLLSGEHRRERGERDLEREVRALRQGKDKKWRAEEKRRQENSCWHEQREDGRMGESSAERRCSDSG